MIKYWEYFDEFPEKYDIFTKRNINNKHILISIKDDCLYVSIVSLLNSSEYVNPLKSVEDISNNIMTATLITDSKIIFLLLKR